MSDKSKKRLMIVLLGVLVLGFFALVLPSFMTMLHLSHGKGSKPIAPLHR